jgi:hypothetical protein
MKISASLEEWRRRARRDRRTSGAIKAVATG